MSPSKHSCQKSKTGILLKWWQSRRKDLMCFWFLPCPETLLLTWLLFGFRFTYVLPWKTTWVVREQRTKERSRKESWCLSWSHNIHVVSSIDVKVSVLWAAPPLEQLHCVTALWDPFKPTLSTKTKEENTAEWGSGRDLKRLKKPKCT